MTPPQGSPLFLGQIFFQAVGPSLVPACLPLSSPPNFFSPPLHPHSSHSVSLEFSSTLRLTPLRQHTCSGMASPPLCSELLFIPQNLTRVSLPLRSLPGPPGLYAGVTQTVLVFHSVEHICSGFQGDDSSYCHDPWEMQSPDRGPQCSHER